MNIVIVGGGTGGHLYPCLALAHLFKMRAETEILFIGTKKGLEAKVVPHHGFRLETIWSEGVVGKSFLRKIRSLFLMLLGMMQSIQHLRRFSPNLVIGIGGYAAGPVIIAAFFLRIRRVILEPNAIPGMMNKLLAPWVHLTVTSFQETASRLSARKIACLGVPVRSEIIAAANSSEKRGAEGPKTVLVLGGSQGARTINQVMIEALPFLVGESISMIHQTGEKDFIEVKEAYARYPIRARVEKFIDKMAEVYTQCDLVVSRSGAGTLSELAVAGIPSLLIPFRGALGHQQKNAEPFVACGASEMFLEKDLIGEDGRFRGEKIAQRIKALFANPQRLSEMRRSAKSLGHPNAASDIVLACLELIGEGARPWSAARPV